MKTTQEIYAILADMSTDEKAILAALEDGQALLALGITDEDQVAVELLHDELLGRVYGR